MTTLNLVLIVAAMVTIALNVWYYATTVRHSRTRSEQTDGISSYIRPDDIADRTG